MLLEGTSRYIARLLGSDCLLTYCNRTSVDACENKNIVIINNWKKTILVWPMSK
jgi:hypothetical protein